MKNTKTAYIALTVSLLSLAGCIQEFIPQNIREESGWLIVDGTITNGESVFVLSRSVGLSEELGEEAMINHAEVAVESNDGARIPARYEGKGRYVAPMGELEATLQYRLSVDLDGDTYQSEYLSPIFSAGIDSIFPMKEGRGTPVCIYLSSHAAENSSKYYRWKYRETWEVKAELYANARWAPEGGGSVIFHSFHTSENTYFCWGRDSSKALIIGDTEKLSQNVVARQKLLEIPCDHDKLSILYHIEAEQMQVREAAYRYFADLQEKVERTGDLFSPILGTGLRGNIYSLNNPEQMVAGYVDVSTTTRKDAYVWERGEDFYEPPRIRCYTGPAKFGYGSIYIYDESSAPERCVDCRTKENASKDKPAGWPTEHL